jgi:dihydrodipicolinate synthase/N-acetylneuraminate lyase
MQLSWDGETVGPSPKMPTKDNLAQVPSVVGFKKEVDDLPQHRRYHMHPKQVYTNSCKSALELSAAGTVYSSA